MKSIFENVSNKCSIITTKLYSTSFSTAVKLLSPSIRQDIYNIYGFVRFADEIVDTFHDYDQEKLFTKFENDLEEALSDKISLNPILNAFQATVHKHHIPKEMIDSFMKSMRLDLYKKTYNTKEEYENYIYGSADVVGLMCLKVFVKGNDTQFNELQSAAMKLGSAFQKVNFLRDLKADYEDLSRSYFPNTDLNQLDDLSKKKIIDEIEADFKAGFDGIVHLPIEAKFGVYTAYIYYKKLLSKLKNTPSSEIKNTRIRVPDYEKYGLFAKCYFNYKFNLI
ncbi:phytoene synthase [Flavobacterium branchiophilum]|uniref:Phytoene synthase n=2 Tax=Flavobacterium branchiophilum TaxID=55197 RepID=G2Z2J2_FLABF|nr:phytoene/squalene synthase family protein [Flavobacterium branchiophilum]OXA74526.1 phytoene synthase [Flavobacterium branchiophilum] [Flavobacterium branchiophilum NBRC 15030 = ATCC 35035]PDS22917.1 phytoene/squalene synthase family protein [Flavobacterium branchiophilum]TQM39427.1 phytoene/squalene synthetase [Flavobacterium branchiophilum]CCB70164.1 Phytoene synthase [Flavobacterium branchiophilum FL-15]GEM55499.1 phytoene synthase [Flavobacterium branchiophilum NBRC 15030 = ATCC 35035]